MALVRLSDCESLQQDLLSFMVDRGQPMTQGEGNVVAEPIFRSEWDLDPTEEYCAEALMLPYILRSEEIRRESELCPYIAISLC